MGHSFSVNLEEIAVPLVILSARAPAGKQVDSPVSLRDLPATVVDLLGLEADSSFAGRSLAAYWNVPASGRVAPEITTTAFSERVDPTGLGGPTAHLERGNFQMSIVAQGQHYIRDGLGAERLFDLRTDPFERKNLVKQADGAQRVETYRRMLLDFLAENPASREVERLYLKRYKEELKAGDQTATGARSVELTRSGVTGG